MQPLPAFHPSLSKVALTHFLSLSAGNHLFKKNPKKLWTLGKSCWLQGLVYLCSGMLHFVLERNNRWTTGIMFYMRGTISACLTKKRRKKKLCCKCWERDFGNTAVSRQMVWATANPESCRNNLIIFFFSQTDTSMHCSPEPTICVLFLVSLRPWLSKQSAHSVYPPSRQLQPEEGRHWLTMPAN